MVIGWEGYLANGGPQGPIYGQDRQRTASNRLLESHRKQSSKGLQQGASHSILENIVPMMAIQTIELSK